MGTERRARPIVTSDGRLTMVWPVSSVWTGQAITQDQARTLGVISDVISITLGGYVLWRFLSNHKQ